MEQRDFPRNDRLYRIVKRAHNAIHDLFLETHERVQGRGATAEVVERRAMRDAPDGPHHKWVLSRRQLQSQTTTFGFRLHVPDKGSGSHSALAHGDNLATMEKGMVGNFDSQPRCRFIYHGARDTPAVTQFKGDGISQFTLSSPALTAANTPRLPWEFSAVGTVGVCAIAISFDHAVCSNYGGSRSSGGDGIQRLKSTPRLTAEALFGSAFSGESHCIRATYPRTRPSGQSPC